MLFIYTYIHIVIHITVSNNINQLSHRDYVVLNALLKKKKARMK